MFNVEELYKYAYDFLEHALKYNNLDMYVFGFSSYSIKQKNSLGQDEECVFAKMEAIYQYYKNNPKSQIDRKLEDVLNILTLNIRGINSVINTLKCVEYQIVAESEGRAPFLMNNEVLLNNLKQNLKQNEALYRSEIYEKNNFMGTIQEHSDLLEKNYGHKVL